MADVTVQLPSFSGGWSHAFGGKNSTFINPSQTIGNFFNGLTGAGCYLFDGSTLPVNATIVSASMTAWTTINSGPAECTVDVNTPARGDIYTRNPWLDPYGREEWRTAAWQAFDMVVRSAGFNIVADSPITPGGNNIFWEINYNESQADAGKVGDQAFRQRLGTKYTAILSAAIIEGFCHMEKTGNLPVGTDLFFTLHPAITVNGSIIPDESTTLATSDPLSVATITVPNAYQFTFSAGQQYTPALGEVFFCVMSLSPQSDATNLLDFLEFSGRTAFFQPQQAVHFGAGYGTDWGNFPSVTDVYGAATHQGSTAVPWTIPDVAAGLPVTSPDLTALIQAQLAEATYESGGNSLILGLTPTTAPGRRILSNWNHATLPAVLDVVYRIDDDIGGGHGGAIFMPGDRRIEKVPDMSDDQLALLAVTAIEVTEE